MKLVKVLQLSGVTVAIDGAKIISDISLDIEEGKLTVLVGRSGAGKSTILKILNRSVKFSGDYNYHNEDVSSAPVLEFRRHIVLVDQVPVPFPGNISDNLTIGCEYWKIKCNSEKLSEILRLVELDLPLGTPIEKISVGQLQRVHLARALALDPEVLLLDEPTSALDALNKENVEKIIRKLVETGKTIVMVTHDLKQAERIADRCVLIEKGRVLMDAPRSEFFKNLENNTDAEILRDLLEVD